MTVPQGFVRTFIVAGDLRVGDRLDFGRTRVDAVRKMRSNMNARLVRKGARAPLLESWPVAEDLIVWRKPDA